MIDIIPSELFRGIQAHVRDRTTHAEEGWAAGSDEEDTLTGDFGGSLRTAWAEHDEKGTHWQWRITYKKFRGRGAGALEKETGADGIFQIEVYPDDDGLVVTKGIIFQAKKVKGSSRADLLDQVQKMERIAPYGSAVFEFGPDGYKGASGNEILILADQSGHIPHAQESLAGYLADKFLPCRSGLRGMYYDAVRHRLVVPGAEGAKIVELRLGHRIGLEVRHENRPVKNGDLQLE